MRRDRKKKGRGNDICQRGGGRGFRHIRFHQRVDETVAECLNEKEKIVYKYGSLMGNKCLSFYGKDIIQFLFQ